MKKALLLDMDGVLVDMEPVHHEARLAIYRKYNMDYGRLQGVPVAGRNTDGIFADVNAILPFPVPLNQAVKEKRDMFVSLLEKSIVPLPGVKALLDRYAGTLVIALVSASARQTVDAAMKSSGLDPYFRVKIYAEKVKRHKPDPEAYLMACSQLNVNPGDCVVFEDSGVGVLAGKRAGAAVVGVRTGHRTEDLSAADLVVPDMEAGRERIIRLIEEEKCR